MGCYGTDVKECRGRERRDTEKVKLKARRRGGRSGGGPGAGLEPAAPRHSGRPPARRAGPGPAPLAGGAGAPIPSQGIPCAESHSFQLPLVVSGQAQLDIIPYLTSTSISNTTKYSCPYCQPANVSGPSRYLESCRKRVQPN